VLRADLAFAAVELPGRDAFVGGDAGRDGPVIWGGRWTIERARTTT
jgi:hypothetical protein